MYPLVTLIVIVLMTAVVLLVVGPLLYELLLTLADGLGFTRVRQSVVGVGLARLLHRLSDYAEYLVAGATLGMVLLPIYLHFVEYAPFWQQTHAHHDGVLHLIVFHLFPSVWINSNILVHFYLAATKDPGRPTAEKHGYCPAICGRCHAPKPPRTHHCSTCNRCVLRADHHCPFTTNCVGEANHHHFLLFVFYGWVATSYAVGLTWHPFLECHAHEAGEAGAEAHPCEEWTDFKPKLFYLALASWAMLSIFLLFVAYLLATDQTTIEFVSFASPRRRREDMMQHYRVRGLGHHLQRILGPYPYWLRYLMPWPAWHAAIPRNPTAEQLMM